MLVYLYFYCISISFLFASSVYLPFRCIFRFGPYHLHCIYILLHLYFYWISIVISLPFAVHFYFHYLSISSMFVFSEFYPFQSLFGWMHSLFHLSLYLYLHFQWICSCYFEIYFTLNVQYIYIFNLFYFSMHISFLFNFILSDITFWVLLHLQLYCIFSTMASIFAF